MTPSDTRDCFGRTINYLRISVTDRCNLRCVYCMPPEGIAWQPHSDLLTYEEIARVARAAAGLGLTRIRLTGGEPLVRKGITSLVEMLAGIPGIEDISLTTNATLLAQLAGPLAKAGLKRVNISIDTLDPQRFATITRGGSLDAVWAGIHAAEAAGLAPIKLNVVVVRGVNDDELLPLARLTETHAWHVRFIEVMPVANEQDWGAQLPADGERYLPVQEMQARLAELALEPDNGQVGNGPARIYRIPGAAGLVGFISPLGEHFCQMCNRLRLTADGRLRPCLLDEGEIPIREALRAGEDMTPYLLRAVRAKPQGHDLTGRGAPNDRKMAQIGG